MNDNKLESGGLNSAPDFTPQRSIWPFMVLTVLMALAIGYMVLNHDGASQAEPIKLETITSIYWSDGDSGRLNGSLKFRLNGIDAPETGGVGAAIGGAKCELERERGYASKEWVVELTRDAELSISKQYDVDRYERLVIDLSASGADVGRAGLASGHYKPWPHKGRKALSKRPVWCDE